MNDSARPHMVGQGSAVSPLQNETFVQTSLAHAERESPNGVVQSAIIGITEGDREPLPQGPEGDDPWHTEKVFLALVLGDVALAQIFMPPPLWPLMRPRLVVENVGDQGLVGVSHTRDTVEVGRHALDQVLSNATCFLQIRLEFLLLVLDMASSRSRRHFSKFSCKMHITSPWWQSATSK